MNNHQGCWLSITDYANYRGKSISTVRRYIKADRVKHKSEKGKYLIWANAFKPSETEKEVFSLNLEIDQMKKMNSKLIEENAELKMLVNLYERNPSKVQNPFPEIPMVN